MASAERLPLADDSADAIACFQAWHWTNPSLAGPECARVLRPAGVLGLGWHALDPGVDWVAELNRITLRPESTAIAEQQDDPEPIPGFGPGERERFTYLMALSPADLAVQAGTWSAVAVHPERERILGQVEDLGAKVAGPDGLVRLPHVTIAVRYRPA
ncbi:methyltransferase domain-containing protein [Dermacoccaceae bacterium W4C1]